VSVMGFIFVYFGPAPFFFNSHIYIPEKGPIVHNSTGISLTRPASLSNTQLIELMRGPAPDQLRKNSAI